MRARGSFTGYACLFNTLDRGRDIVLSGAFTRSIRERGARGIKILWQHDPSEPIGILDEIGEDRRGLHIKGRLLLEVGRAREAYALMQAAALDGLSIGYRALTADSDPKTGARLLREIDLWEISLVTFPMQDGARVQSVKSEACASDWAGIVRSLERARMQLDGRV